MARSLEFAFALERCLAFTAWSSLRPSISTSQVPARSGGSCVACSCCGVFAPRGNVSVSKKVAQERNCQMNTCHLVNFRHDAPFSSHLFKLAVCFPTTVNPKPRSDCSTERTNGRGSDNVADGGEKPATVFVSVVVGRGDPWRAWGTLPSFERTRILVYYRKKCFSSKVYRTRAARSRSGRRAPPSIAPPERGSAKKTIIAKPKARPSRRSCPRSSPERCAAGYPSYPARNPSR